MSERFERILKLWENGMGISESDLYYLVKQSKRTKQLESENERLIKSLKNCKEQHHIKIRKSLVKHRRTAIVKENKVLKSENERLREGLEEILSVERDEEFNPLAYMALEIMDIAREALERESNE